MNKLIQLCMVIVTSFPLCAEDSSFPPELSAAKEKYDEAIEKAVAPIRANYVKYLERIKDELASNGRLKEALIVENEITVLSKPKSNPVVEDKTKIVDKMELVVDSRLGAQVGPAKEGQTIRLEYESGKWKQGGAGFELRSPDEDGKQVVVVGIIGDKKEELWVVPRDTDRRAFRERFTKNFDEIWLKMNDFNPGDNEGEVVYKITIK